MTGLETPAIVGNAAKIAVVDYCKGNLASVQRGLADAGYDARITTEPADIIAADGIVLPGVGAFTDAMTTMNQTGQTEAIRESVQAGTPFLGICLGVHLLFDWGDEGCEPGERMGGLGLLPGHVERMADRDADGKKYKIPHVGWNSAEFVQGAQSNPLFAGLEDSSYFYFTHSYCAVPDLESDIIATTVHAKPFASVVCRDNIYGVQFHPEKSSADGLKVLVNFGKIVENA